LIIFRFKKSNLFLVERWAYSIDQTQSQIVQIFVNSEII